MQIITFLLKAQILSQSIMFTVREEP